MEVVVGSGVAERTKRFGRRYQCGEQEQEPDVRNGGVADQNIAIEQAGPPVPQQHCRGAAAEPETEQDRKSEKYEQEDGDELR